MPCVVLSVVRWVAAAAGRTECIDAAVGRLSLLVLANICMRVQLQIQVATR